MSPIMATPWAILICTFKDDPPGSSTNPPVSLPLVTRFFTKSDGSFNLVRYFSDMSHGQIDLTASQVFPGTGSLVIDAPADAGTDALVGHARKAAIDAGIDLSLFFGVIVLLGAGGTHGWSRNVYADPRYVETNGASALGHETGHGYGFAHARLDGSEDDYQDPWDIMSFAAWPSVISPDPDYGRHGPGLNAWHMRSRGWLDESRVWTPPAGNFSQVVDLRPLHRHDLSGLLAAELPPVAPFAYDPATRALFPDLTLKDADHGQYLIEYRPKVDWDASIVRSAVLVHRYDQGHSYLMHSTSGDTDFAVGDKFAPFGSSGGLCTMKVVGIDDQAMTARIELSWGPPRIDLPPGLAGADDTLFIAATSPSGRVIHNRAKLGQGGVGWVEMESGGRVSSAPAVGASGRHVFVAARGLDGNIYLNQADVGGAFGLWGSMHFSTDVAPAVAGVGDKVYFFTKSPDGRLFYDLASVGGAGQGWSEVEGGGRLSSAPSAGAVGNHVFVAGRGLDGRLYLNQADVGKPFGNWRPMDFISDAAPAVTGVGDNIYFFAKAVDGRIFFNRAKLGQGGVGWVEVEGGGRTDAAPSAAAIGTHVFVGVRGLDGRIYINQADLGRPFGQWIPA